MSDRRAVRWVWVVSVLLLAGCSSSPSTRDGSGGFPKYNVIRLYNDSPAEIYDIELSAGGTVTALDHLPAEHSPVSDRGVSPDPETVSVRWRDGDGERYERDVPVSKNLPLDFRGVIVLRLLPGGEVAMNLVPYSELK